MSPKTGFKSRLVPLLLHPVEAAVVLSGGTGFYTELCEGSNLRSALDHDVIHSSSKDPRQLSWYIEGHRIALDVACGMHFLHRYCRVVHGMLFVTAACQFELILHRPKAVAECHVIPCVQFEVAMS